MPPRIRWVLALLGFALPATLGAADPGVEHARYQTPLDQPFGAAAADPADDPAEAESYSAEPADPFGAPIPHRGRRPPVRFQPAPERQDQQVVQASALTEVEEDSVELSPPRPEKSLALSPPRESSRSTRQPLGGVTELGTVLGSLAAVLGLFFVVAWLFRRGVGKNSQMLPKEVLEVLGRCVLVGRQNVHLVRCGNKLLLLSITVAGAETLTEITDPAEVDRLTGLCYQSHPHSASTAFRQVFQQFNADASGAYSSGTRVERLDLSKLDELAGRPYRRETLDD